LERSSAATTSNRGGARRQLEQSSSAAAAAGGGSEQKEEDEERNIINANNTISFPVATLPRGEQPLEELHFRRQRDVVYSKRKRERQRIEVEELQKQELHWRAWNEVLRCQSLRLEELLRNAHDEIRRRRNGGGGSGGGGGNDNAPIS
jgi:hypothetical protein